MFYEISVIHKTTFQTDHFLVNAPNLTSAEKFSTEFASRTLNAVVTGISSKKLNQKEQENAITFPPNFGG